jgi:hypothetical protein
LRFRHSRAELLSALLEIAQLRLFERRSYPLLVSSVPPPIHPHFFWKGRLAAPLLVQHRQRSSSVDPTCKASYETSRFTGFSGQMDAIEQTAEKK